MKKIFMLLVACVAMVFVSCSKDDDKSNNEEINENKNIPSLLFGKWKGNDSRGQSLTFIIRKDGTCFYQREAYVKSEGIFIYDSEEKKITTTIEENGEGPVVYIIELLTSEKLVVKKAAYDRRISYTKDMNYKEE